MTDVSQSATTPNQPLWVPDADRIATTQIDQFRRDALPSAANSDEVWQWSVDQPGEFWKAVWDHCGVVGDRGDRLVEEGENFWDWRFLPDATLNFAETLLADRPGADPIAIIARREDGVERSLTWDELRQQVSAVAGFLEANGVESGDRVGAWMPHVPETVVMFLAAASIGAVFTSTSADFGVAGVVDRFGQTEPKILIAADGYHYGGKTFDCLERLAEIETSLPSVSHVVVVPNVGQNPDLTGLKSATNFNEILTAHADRPVQYTTLPTDHPLYILYSSGTTGKPKCIVHRSGGVLLKHLAEQQLQCDIKAGDQVFYFTTCGWMMWNWLVSVLGSGATIVLYDGNPAYPRPEVLFDLCDEYNLTLLGVSAKFLDASMKGGLRPIDTHSLDSVRSICSTGSPLSHEGFAWVYEAVKHDVHLASMSGGTDLCGCLVAGDPSMPVFAGAIQRACYGMHIEVFDDDRSHLNDGSKGELVCTTPFPSMPLEFWGDEDGSRYQAAYFERFPGVWAHGDFASWTPEHGMVIHGRSDATLNASGIRIGTAEIYRVVEQLDEVVEAICIGHEYDNDTRIVLFVRLIEGETLTDELVKTIKSELRTKCSPRHVPAVIKAVADIPRTRSGKIVELAVTEVVHGRPIKNIEALANPEALDLFTLSD